MHYRDFIRLGGAMLRSGMIVASVTGRGGTSHSAVIAAQSLARRHMLAYIHELLKCPLCSMRTRQAAVCRVHGRVRILAPVRTCSPHSGSRPGARERSARAPAIRTCAAQCYSSMLIVVSRLPHRKVLRQGAKSGRQVSASLREAP